ncbi:transposase, partial [Geomonas sp. Red875]|nr:transposase [Geomesophilobacter sediminis]
MLQLVSYIHLNPVRAKITKDVALYQWSSHKTYLGQEEIPWLSTKPILSYFGTRLKAARIAFDRMVREKAEEGHHEEFYTGCKYDSRLLGGDDFYVDVQAKTDELPRTTPDLQTIIETVEQICNLEAGELNAG